MTVTRYSVTGLQPARRARFIEPAAVALLASVVVVSPAAAQRIENKVAVFAALDKVTARISKLQIPLNDTVKFGSLRLTPRVCYSRPATEQPKTTTFVEIEESLLNGQDKRLFTGWMFAESPGLNAVEHPVFDVWLTECRDPLRPLPQTAATGQPGRDGAGATGAAGEEPPARRRVRR